MVMLFKIVSNIFLGLNGIFFNKYLNIKKKHFLFFDYVKLFLILICVYFFKKKVTSVKIHSFNYKIFFKNYITFFYSFNEIFCKCIYKPIKINTFFDLGANIGLSILWYKFFNPQLKIVAFEPDRYSFRYLIKNLETNLITNTKLYNLALSDKKGKTNFYTIIDDIQNLDSGLTLNQNLPYETYQVSTNILSSFIIDKIDLLKMDIEGSEYQVFDDIFRNKKINYFNNIIFEAHYFNLEQKNKLKNIVEELIKIGKVECLENSKITKIFYYQRLK